MKEAELYELTREGRVRCTACARYCQLAEGQVGFCGMRQNRGGRLYLLTYGKVLAVEIDPIEKKPVTHFGPGTKIFSIGTAGCDFMCGYCINYDLSQRRTVAGEDISPAGIARLAASQGCEGVAYTYNEPTIFIEFAKDVGLEARRRGMFNVFVTNGFESPQAVEMMSKFLDCATVDFKGNGEKSFVRKYVGIPSAERIYDTLLEIRDKTKIHVEITDLVVPGVGDDLEEAENLSRWLFDNLGPQVPVHFLRFFPSYKMMDFPETPISTLEAHCQIAREAGLEYVYIGNAPGHPYESTYCASCGQVAVGRIGMEIVSWSLDANNACTSCGARIPIIGAPPATPQGERLRPVVIHQGGSRASSDPGSFGRAAFSG